MYQSMRYDPLGSEKSIRRVIRRQRQFLRSHAVTPKNLLELKYNQSVEQSRELPNTSLLNLITTNGNKVKNISIKYNA